MQQSRELCLLRIPIGVYGREVLPLLREIIERENCGHGADWNTGSAVNALHRADVKLGLAFEGRLIFARMDTDDRGSATKELRYNTKPFEAQVARNRPARGAVALTLARAAAYTRSFCGRKIAEGKRGAHPRRKAAQNARKKCAQ